MSEKKTPFRKTLTWAAVAYGAFTTLSVVVPIVLDKIWNKSNKS
ncbi:MAG TPA: hypothetical protein VF026_10355 [Ktedonobacteraceae bacterium]